MTRCELAARMLAGYAAGELEQMEEAIVAEHLAECAACRNELLCEQRLRALMGDLPAAACPDEVTAAIVAAVEAEAGAKAEAAPRRPFEEGLRARPSRVHTWTSTVAVASLLAAAVLLVLVLPRSEPLLDTAAAPTHRSETDTWTQDELDRAREDAQWALAFTASVIERVEKQTIVDVMRRLQEEAYAGFRERTPSTSTGGRG